MGRLLIDLLRVLLDVRETSGALVTSIGKCTFVQN